MQLQSITKRCPKCGETKPRSEFHHNKGAKDGLRSDCKVCNCAATNARNHARSDHTVNLTESPTDGEKRCPHCGEIKRVSEFAHSKCNSSGLQSWCRSCKSADQSVRQRNNPRRTKEIKQKYRDNADGKYKVHARIYRRTYPEKVKARSAVRNAVIQGKLPAASTQFCFICGTCAEMGATIQYHHVDYSKPLEVIPLCSIHHAQCHPVTKR